MKIIYIVVFEDGSLMIYANRQKESAHQAGACQYMAGGKTTLLDLSEWLGGNHDIDICGAAWKFKNEED